ncbi:MAG TPA: hypothetical protein VHA37_01900 [Candidatus Saccharimonadales bacterium]|nr:hypothetical protein [Candidatus Saccharimonadales bacterium]
MNFLLDLVMGQLDLSDAEHAAVDAALPDLKAVVDSINDVLPDLQDGNKLYLQSQTLVLRLFTDYSKVGPSLSALLGNGWVDIPNVMAAASDAQSAVKSDPATVKAAEALYAKLQPVVMGAYQKWPTIKPAYDAVMAALARKHMTLAQALANMTAQQ